MEARVPPMSPGGTTTDSLTKRFPRAITLASPLAEADKQRHRDGSNDEEDKADGQAHFFAELVAARRGGRRRGVRRVGIGGGKQGEDGAAKDFGIVVSLVDYEGEGEIGGWLAVEPNGRHVEEDGTLKVGGVARCEYVCGGWRVEAGGVDVVDLYCIICAVFEEGGVPSHCEVLACALHRTFKLRPTLIRDIWVYVLSITWLAKGISDIRGTFWVRCVCPMAHVRIIRVVERTGRGGGYRSSRREGRSLHSSIRSCGRIRNWHWRTSCNTCWQARSV